MAIKGRGAHLAAVLLVLGLTTAGCGAGHQPAAGPGPAEPSATGGTGPDDSSGTWVLQEAQTTAEVDSPAVEMALATPVIRGYSLRVAWSDIDGNTALLDAGARTAAAHHVALSIRFMAGRWTPARVIADGSPYYTVGGRKVPTPFFPDGKPNSVFERAYSDELDALDAWCHAHGVHLLHLPWYGQNYAELNYGIEVRSQPGFTYQRWLEAHERLVDIAVKHMAPDLAVEYPLSGYGPLTQAAPDLAGYIAGAIGGRTEEFYVQANGLGPGGSFGSQDPQVEKTMNARIWALPIGHGEQLIDPGDFDWSQIYGIAEQNGATYVEVYSQSFGPGLAHHAQLLKAIADFAARAPSPAPSP
jgi:hypothetical protein